MEERANHKHVCDSLLGAELDEPECQVLAEIMGVCHISDGEKLVSEGDTDSRLYVLIDGKIDIISTTANKEEHVYTMTKGECAGTRAFIDRSPRKATLRAEGDATVYTLEPDAFESLLDTHPRIVYKVMRALFRITHTNLLRMNLESEQLFNYISKSKGRY